MTEPISSFDQRIRLLSVGTVLVIALLLIGHFFEWFPHGWDQTEYAWCLKQNYLPHSPYILHFLLGKAFYWVLLDAAKALSALSLTCGMASLLFMYIIGLRSWRLDGKKTSVRWGPTILATAASFLLATNYLFVRQASTQEIYIVQLAFLLLSALLILSPKKGSAVAGGIACGCAFAVHNSSIFLLPCLLFLAWCTSAQCKRPARYALLAAGLAMMATCAVFYAIIYVLLPESPDGDQFGYYLAYLRGIAPGVNLSRLADPSFIARSSASLVARLTSMDIPHGRMPCATFPLGIAVPHLALAVLAAVLSFSTHRRQTIFWILWCVPYLGYEILIGGTPDFGVYAVFVLPPVMAFLALLLAWCVVKWSERPASRRLVTAGSAVIMACVILPSVILLTGHWNDIDTDAVKHYSPLRLAAAAAAEVLPQNAVIMQSKYEWNVNSLPYYSERGHALRQGPYLLILAERRRFAPMNVSSYELVTTTTLAKLILGGTPVYSFEPDPLLGLSERFIDANVFEWHEDVKLNLSKAKARLAIGENTAARLAGWQFPLYKGAVVRDPHLQMEKARTSSR